jgi:hypothetical protein
VGSGEKVSKAMNEFVVHEMILSGFCPDDFIERVMVHKALIPVPLLPSKAFRKMEKKEKRIHISFIAKFGLNLPQKLNVCTFIYLAHSQVWLNIFIHESSLESYITKLKRKESAS